MSIASSKMLKGLTDVDKLAKDAIKNYQAKERTKTKVIEVKSGIPQVNKLSRLEFNKRIGNPYSRLERKRKPLTPDQLQYIETVDDYGKVICDKNRKGGFSEGYMRKKAQDVFTRDVDSDIVFLAGNAASVAKLLLDRFDEYFENGFEDQNGTKWKYGDIISNYVTTSPAHIEFYHGTNVYGIAASNRGQGPNLRGTHKISSMWLTEAAHTGLRNDSVILNAMTANLANIDYGELVLESTPNGKRGIFWDVWNQAEVKDEYGNPIYGVPGPNKFARLLYSWQSSVKYKVISQQFIDDEKANPAVDFDQEYCGKFTTSKNAAFDDDEVQFLDEGDSSIDLGSMLED